MAFDGIMVRAICSELNRLLCNAKVDKVAQPQKDEVVLTFRGIDPATHTNVQRKLLLSANPAAARICLTQQNKENPSVAPNFCMLLRKHLSSARFLSARQPGLERVVVLDFECRTELFETVIKHLIFEVMGRYSNVILADAEMKILDALRQTDLSDDKRRILPGVVYEMPPAQQKEDLLQITDVAQVLTFLDEGRLDRYLCATFLGMSPLVAREIALGCCGQTDAPVSSLTAEERSLCCRRLNELALRIRNEQFCPVFIKSHVADRAGQAKPIEYYCFDIEQYDGTADKDYPETCSQAIELFFEEKSRREYFTRASADIRKVLNTVIARLSRKVEHQKGELFDCQRSQTDKLYGDLLTANLYLVHGGEREITVVNYYDPAMKECRIPLDPTRTAVQNAQLYYRRYKKAQTAQKVLEEQIPLALHEITYLNGVLESLDHAQSLTDIAQIREELVRQGYLHLRAKKTGRQPKKEPSYFPAEFRSTDGFVIYAGRNNLQNDYLTLKMAEKHDIWFHIKNYSGSHVVVCCNGKTPPAQTLTQAAVIAATMGKDADGAKVEVDYTEVKNVKKPNGARPGMVVYDPYQTAVVRPDPALIDELIVKK